ncbi:MAG: HAMP domain-containing protein [Candidatus Aminicenantes bacterium]|nr:HAMP domain-containing protein [Candidatus Aminicenantes bacterium]
MKKRIFWKFFAGFFLLSVSLALALYFLIIGQLRSLYLQTTEEFMSRLGTLVAAELSPLWPLTDAAALDGLIKEKGGLTETRLTVIDPQGLVLADSQKDPREMENHSDRPEIAAAFSGRERSEIHFSFTLRESMMYYALPLKAGGKTVAVLRLSRFVRELDLTLAPWRWRITAVLLGLLGVSLVLSFLLSRNLTRPIRELAQAARHVASGSLESPVRSRRRDELGQLTADFNAMVESQKTMVAELRRGRHELEVILSSISDGLLVIDGQERIVRAGPLLRELVEDPEPVGKSYWEVLRLGAIDELLRQAEREGPVLAEIEIQHRPFLVSVSPLPADGGKVITFHDLSETRRLEKVKKDFVANVSHELRTPLTAIKGYTETLAEDASGNDRRYLDVILRHTDRLIDLTNDLLSLSQLEEKGLALHREAIDWPAFIADIRALFEKRICEKALTLDVSLPADPKAIAFQGDRFRLEQMLINLLDNAVKYTDRGGIAIRVAAVAGELQLEVEDSGRGIDPQHLPRLFERFYVADKARSRQGGGTGLGLAIVKHIVHLHGGRIDVRSSPGRGTVFSVFLPLSPPPAKHSA